MVDGLKDAVSHGYYGFLWTEAGFERIVFGSVIRPLLFDRRPSHFHHDGFETVVSYSTPPAESFPSTLIVARAQTAPRCQGCSAGKRLKTRADLRQDCVGRYFTDSRNLFKSLHFFFNCSHTLADSAIEDFNLALQLLNSFHQQGQKKSMMLFKEALNRPVQLLTLFPDRSLHTVLYLS